MKKYSVMQPINRDGRDNTFWQRVGTAFENPAKGGEGVVSISVLMDSLPLGGKVVLFPDNGERNGAGAGERTDPL